MTAAGVVLAALGAVAAWTLPRWLPPAVVRGEGAGLSDLFWYWLAPGAHMHQEHLEPGERYRTAARTTRQVLAVRHARSGTPATRSSRTPTTSSPP